MQEYSTPLAVDIDESAALPDAVKAHASSTPDAVVFRRKSPNGWTPVTAKQFSQEVAAVAKGLIASGVKPGDRVGLMPCTPTTSPSPTNTPCVGRVVHRIERVTRAPFDQKFKPRVDQLAASFGTVQTTKSGGVWSITSNSTGLTWYLITGNACNQNFTGTAALGTNYFVNCPAEGNWSLSNTWC